MPARRREATRIRKKFHLDNLREKFMFKVFIPHSEIMKFSILNLCQKLRFLHQIWVHSSFTWQLLYRWVRSTRNRCFIRKTQSVLTLTGQNITSAIYIGDTLSVKNSRFKEAQHLLSLAVFSKSVFGMSSVCT